MNTNDPETFYHENTEQILNVLRHSSNTFARAAAWTIIDEACTDPELERLHRELDQLEERRQVSQR